MNADESDELITAEEAAAMINRSVKTVYRLLKKGTLKGVTQAGRRLVSRRSAEEWARPKQIEPESETHGP